METKQSLRCLEKWGEGWGWMPVIWEKYLFIKPCRYGAKANIKVFGEVGRGMGVRGASWEGGMEKTFTTKKTSPLDVIEILIPILSPMHCNGIRISLRATGTMECIKFEKTKSKILFDFCWKKIGIKMKFWRYFHAYILIIGLQKNNLARGFIKTWKSIQIDCR